MRNGEARLVGITLDKPRRLRFDVNAFVAYEEATGLSVMAGGLESGLRSMKSLRALLWAALLHEDPELTQEQVGAFIHLGSLNEVSEQLRAAIAQAVPDQDEEPEGNAPAAGGSRRGGRTSGR